VNRHRFVVTTLFAILAAGPVSAKSKTDIVIEPGPATISAEERALEADPAAGTEHAVVLVHDVERDDRKGTGFEKGVHVRAKIFSNEGRSLGDVEIPIGDGGKLKRWWGRTLLPDGTVLDLAEGDLKRQNVARGEGFESSVLKGALPGIVPGAVIDFGYVLLDDGMPWLETIEIQRPWLVRQMRYRWRSSDWLQAAWLPKRLEGIDADIQKDRESILVLASNVPPFVDEPYMPPESEVRASVTIYYIEPTTNFETFWDDTGRRLDAAVKRFLVGRKGIKEVADGIPPGATMERLASAYEWIEKNVRRSGLLSAEEIEATAKTAEGEESKFSARAVLERREGTTFEVAALFVGLADELGGVANLMFVPDRTLRYWDPNLKSVWAFDHILVAVESPEGGGKKVIVDPGSGLPFGEIPWWLTGVQGMVCTSKGAKPLPVPMGEGRKNTLQTKVALSFADDLDAESATWSRLVKGQGVFGVRHRLRRSDPEERRQDVERFCGGGGEIEVLEAETEGLDRLGGDLTFRCKNERSGLGIDPEVDRVSIEFGGPWMSRPPELGASVERRHAAIFEYQWIGTEEIIVNAPTGFEPDSTRHEPIQLDTPYGRYTLRIDHGATAYRVQRMLAFGAIHVPPGDIVKLRSFVDDIRRHDRTALVFRRRAQP
jgi:hypothetical protein